MNSKVKIYLLGNIDKYSDEAEKNITKKLFAEISRRHEVRYGNAKDNIFNVTFWKEMIKFKPDVIHIFLRPTVRVLLYSYLIKHFVGETKIIISALQPPKIVLTNFWIMKILKVDLFITASSELKDFFKALGCSTTTLPCGVDIKQFKAVDIQSKMDLRKKYGIPLEKYVVLHVGHATKGRNLPILNRLMHDNIQVLFVASKSFNIEKGVTDILKQAGCIVVTSYIETIEEIYELSDCYVFPTMNKSNAVELPLSVLEAMACNLPVVTTAFGALPELFIKDESLIFFDGTATGLVANIDIMKNKTTKVNNRSKVSDFDWEIAARKLESIYQGLLSGGLG